MPTPKFDIFAGLLVEEQTTQATSLPTASASYEGKIFQYIGTTTSDYINGYFYKCVASTGETPTYSWTRVNVQPSGGSGGGAVDDVTVNGVSVVSSGVAVIPNASSSAYGAVKVDGTTITATDGVISGATQATITYW